MFRYRLYTPDGDDLGEATSAQMIHLGEEIHFHAGKRYCVIDVVVHGEERRLAVCRAAAGRGGVAAQEV
jgi:hypothetical protein